MTVPDEAASEPGIILGADRPVEDPTQDRLGYSPFAEALAKAIASLPHDESIVIGIHGEWGLGKTTVLNFTERFLSEKASAQSTIIRFNPWWFTGREDLVRQFFRELEVTLRSKRTKAKDLAKAIGSFGESVAGAAGEYGGILRWLFSRMNGRPTSPSDLKRKAVKILTKSKRRIIVFIDDVDRLSGEETRELFSAVKALGDFPGLAYVVAFDRKIVAKALDDAHGGQGDAYLDKILQTSFTLPRPSTEDLTALLSARIDVTVVDFPEPLFNEIEWANLYYQGISHFVRTPRDVVRLANFVALSYPQVKGEVNIVDFIGLQALRAFVPEVYDMIRTEYEQFAGVKNNMYGVHDDGGLKKFHDAWMEQVPDHEQEAVKYIIQSLFPKLKSVWSNWHYGSEHLASWRRGRRIAVPELQEPYFQLGPPKATLSQREIDEILKAARHSEGLTHVLRNYANTKLYGGKTKARVALEVMQDYTRQDIPESQIVEVLKALFEVSDELMLADGGRAGMLGFGIDTTMGQVCYQLLRRVPNEIRLKTFGEAAESSAGIVLKTRLSLVLIREHEPRNEDKT